MSDLPRLPRLRADLAGLPVYRAGARPSAGNGPAYSLASNESPDPPSPAVLDAVAKAAGEGNRYPDPGNAALLTALSESLGVSTERIGLGTGSVALCQQAVVAAAGPGDEVLYAWRSFEAYPIITQLAGATPVQVPLLTDGRHDLAAMADSVTPRTRVVFLCTPNNPTGPALSHQEVEGFLDRLPPDLLVVMDEAYHEYVTMPDAADGVAVAAARPNVLALRTLSKAYGLAGLRVGYGVGHPELMARLRQTALPFGVSRLAEAAAVAVLGERDEVARRVSGTLSERVRVVAALIGEGWRVPQAQGNFVWLPLGDRTDAFAAHCLRFGITVRAFPGEGVRVTVAESEANDVFLRAAAQWPQAQPVSATGPVVGQ